MYALETPSSVGSTEFASFYRLYDECDAETREVWSVLEVEYQSNSTFFAGRPDRRLPSHSADLWGDASVPSPGSN